MNMLTTLKRIVQELNRIPGLDPALARLVSLVKEAMQVDSCSLYLADYEQQHFELRATDGLAPDAIGQVKIGFSEGLIGLVGQREEPLNIENAHQHPRFKHYDEVKEEQYNAFLGTPIIYQRKVLGVLTMQQQAMRRFSEDEEAFLVTLATQIAIEIANADMLGELILSESNALPAGTQEVSGVAGSSGLAMGVGFVRRQALTLDQIVSRKTRGLRDDIDIYRQAVKKTKAEVTALSAGLDDSLPEDVRGIFVLYDQLLDANSLGREVEAQIRDGWDAPSALKIVIEDYAARFRAMEDPYMQERAVDIIDLSNRILANIIKRARPDQFTPDTPFILVAEEISAPMLAEYQDGLLQGIIAIRGSQNSHAAILARAMGLPAIMGVNSVLPGILEGKWLFIDGYAGTITISPSATQKEVFQTLIDEEHALFDKMEAQSDLPTITQDQHAISLLINAGLSVDLDLQDKPNIAGVGLFRTEIPFMLREGFPSEQEQFQLYRSILQAHPDKEITMRTLDVGGDKPLPYFPITEENPFLGWRGIRMTLDQPEIFLVQARAMIRASEDLTNLHILLPMITTVNEVKEAKRLLKQAFFEVRDESSDNRTTLMMPQIGIMIEVPAAAHQIPQLAAEVDFFSVGTNDLTQYLLAVDRNNPKVSNLYNGFHPAVLNVLQDIVNKAKLLHVPITVCGELAGDPAGAILLMAMGYDKLSMSAYNIRKINWVLRSIHLYSAQHLLSEVINMHDPAQIKARIDQYLEEHQLGGLVRAGA